MLTNATANATSTGPQAPPTAAQQASGDFQMFLKMMTAQIQNQDPLNPMDASDYAVQLATFSGVEQQVKTNELLTALMGQMGVTALGQYAGWVGMDAKTTAPVGYSGAPLTLYPAPAVDAARTVLVAYDARNHEVLRQEIPVSADPILWTGQTQNGGQVLNGAYSFRLESLDAAGKVIATDNVSAFGRITEVRQSATGPQLVLAGGATIAPAEVKALRPGGAPS